MGQSEPADVSSSLGGHAPNRMCHRPELNTRRLLFEENRQSPRLAAGKKSKPSIVGS